MRALVWNEINIKWQEIKMENSQRVYLSGEGSEQNGYV